MGVLRSGMASMGSGRMTSRRGFLGRALGALLLPALPLPKLAAKPVKPVVQSLLVFKPITLKMHSFTGHTFITRELMADCVFDPDKLLILHDPREYRPDATFTE